MNSLVTVLENVPVISHEVVAHNINLQTESIRDLISKYKTDMLEFGDLKIDNLKTDNNLFGGKPKIIYYLNEQQATLLMTYLRNNEVVRNFKKQLVKEFYELRTRQEKLQNELPIHIKQLQHECRKLQKENMRLYRCLEIKVEKEVIKFKPYTLENFRTLENQFIAIIIQFKKFRTEYNAMTAELTEAKKEIERLKKLNNECIKNSSKYITELGVWAEFLVGEKLDNLKKNLSEELIQTTKDCLQIMKEEQRPRKIRI